MKNLIIKRIKELREELDNYKISNSDDRKEADRKRLERFDIHAKIDILSQLLNEKEEN